MSSAPQIERAARDDELQMVSLRGIKEKLPRLKSPTEWGIEPVPPARRVLGFLDFFVLWGDLGIGLLVMLAGTFLVPGLSLGHALLAILIGSAAGCFLLALVGVIGSATGVPTMVLLRPVLGVRGSFAPTVLNVLQLIGWTIFEFVVMGVAASTIARTLFGSSSYVAWAAVFAAIVILMGVGGPDRLRAPVAGEVRGLDRHCHGHLAHGPGLHPLRGE